MNGDSRITKAPRRSSHSSVITQPSSVGSNRHAQFATLNGPIETWKAKRRPRSHAVTVPLERHFFEPIWFVPLKRAPRAGP